MPKAAERCETLEQFLVNEMQFQKRDVHVYSDLSRKNITRVIEDL